MQLRVGRQRTKASQARKSLQRTSPLDYDERHSQVHSANDIGELKNYHTILVCLIEIALSNLDMFGLLHPGMSSQLWAFSEPHSPKNHEEQYLASDTFSLHKVSESL